MRSAGGRKAVVSAFLNVIGLSMAFVALYAIMVQVSFDLGYNRKIKDSDRIFSVGMKNWYSGGRTYQSWLSRPLWEDVIDNLPCVESGGTASYLGDVVFYTDRDMASGVTLTGGRMSRGAMRVFGMTPLAGKTEDMVSGNDLAVSASVALSLGLSAGDPLYGRNGDGGCKQYRVAVVYEDFPKGTDVSDWAFIFDVGDESIESFSDWSYPYYVKLRSAGDREDFERLALERIMNTLVAVDGEPSEEGRRYLEERMTPRLFAIRDLYFDRNIESAGPQGSRTATRAMLAIAVLVIFIAFVNFVNYLFALIPVKLRSVNTRKILGTPRSTLVLTYVAKASMLVLCAFFLSVIAVLPLSGSVFNSLISGGIAPGDHAGILFAELGIALVLGAGSSIYPVMYMTSFPPVLALKGNFGATVKGRAFRYTLIGVQFVISISLVICSTFVTMQRSYMMDHDMGFDRSSLLSVQVSSSVAKSYKACGDKLLSDPRIEAVTWADGEIVARDRMGWGRMWHGENINFKCYPVHWDFLRVMGIEVVEGRDFSEADESSDDGVFIFNEAARDKFGLTLEDKMPGYIKDSEIAGFCRNFNFTSLSNPVGPLALYVYGSHRYNDYSQLYIRTVANADIPSVFRHVRSTLMEIDPSLAEGDINIFFFDQRLGMQYKSERNNSVIIASCALLAIIISLMGVFCLVMFESEYRRKEIGVRRVNGASVPDILRMLNAKFIKIVLGCFVIAVPLSWFLTDRYLQGFAYRMPVHWWVFAAALLAVLSVTVLVVTLRSYSAAAENPSVSLKRE